MLKVSIGQWKEKYLVESPIKGKVTFTSYWNENQVIKAGDILATVIPEDTNRIIVRADVPVSGLGRVKVGQEVNIKTLHFHT
jgi:multidrug resistance efflux pump